MIISNVKARRKGADMATAKSLAPLSKKASKIRSKQIQERLKASKSGQNTKVKIK
jgi:hypothetical protein